VNVEISGDKVVVTLSRSNVNALLHKLDWEPSYRTIYRLCENNRVLVLVAQEDEEHYTQRESPRGAMHPDTEEYLQAQK
jgi:hypothetical protein